MGKKTHGMWDTPTYRSWKAMRRRCSDQKHPLYRHYGGRGIKVCEEWTKFENFLSDMGVRPWFMTIDRKDPDGNYEKSNCKWSTDSEQQLNRRPYAQKRHRKTESVEEPF